MQTGSAPDEDFALLNGYIYFTAARPAEGRELWRTDGTAGGTNIVKDIITGPVGSNAANLYNLFSNGSYLLFSANTPASLGYGTELYKSDGTDVGTTVVKDINPGTPSSAADFFYKYNDMVLFLAADGVHGTELWKTDGTESGTQLIKDIDSNATTSILFGFFYTFNNRVYFNANKPQTGEELWSTDGTTQNTVLLKDIQAGPIGSFSSIITAINVGNKFIFSAFNLLYGLELWESDGTEAGTKIFLDIVPGPTGSNAFSYPPFNFSTGVLTQPLFQGNKFFFMATSQGKGNELWISDGSVAGTNMVKDVNSGNKNGIESPSYLYTSSALYFAADNDTSGNELWMTDGTAAGTAIVADINVGPGNSDIIFGQISGNKIYFTATDGDDENTDLYRLDGVFTPLPVKLAEFTATAKNEDGLLQWTTLTEVNSKNFTIQRSDDGTTFVSIGTIEALGFSSRKHTYNYTDAGIVKSGKDIVYYRLVMKDNDGKTGNSKVIPLKLKGNQQWSIRLLKNPLQSDIEVMVKGITENTKMSICDMAGKTLQTTTVKAAGLINLPAHNLVSGMYLLVVENNNERKVIKFIKK